MASAECPRKANVGVVAIGNGKSDGWSKRWTDDNLELSQRFDTCEGSQARFGWTLDSRSHFIAKLIDLLFDVFSRQTFEYKLLLPKTLSRSPMVVHRSASPWSSRDQLSEFDGQSVGSHANMVVCHI
ncbi:plasma membrane multidrug transporter [Pseudozyma hubeiensis SY62]|uniref:Plasma membrane multidrug transporter n=1 Tax=Pseudozyma hubeiensis (strain SY62) TaxID=1305764 RepID=R9PCU0_PSEHS|nr:plasma membrane multidrug transporter [Pseudozyma hubeiensis SY62]GAC99179.1 plasma membrane multidrug transporter [Pseudozyma hubeiensis SY62]